MKRYLGVTTVLLVNSVIAVWSFSSFSLHGNSLIAGTDFVIDSFRIMRPSWDIIHIDCLVKDKPQRIKIPYQVSLKVYDSSLRLIAESENATVSFDDATLLSEEILTIQTVVKAKGKRWKHAQKIKASKKKIHIEPLIEYPLRNEIYSGACVIEPQLMREKWGVPDKWENIYTNKRELYCYLTVFENQSNRKIAFPVKQGSGVFSLKESPHYTDFIREVQKTLYSKGNAEIFFQVEVFKNNHKYQSEEKKFTLSFGHEKNTDS
jgi:hypothetical protein